MNRRARACVYKQHTNNAHSLTQRGGPHKADMHAQAAVHACAAQADEHSVGHAGPRGVLGGAVKADLCLCACVCSVCARVCVTVSCADIQGCVCACVCGHRAQACMHTRKRVYTRTLFSGLLRSLRKHVSLSSISESAMLLFVSLLGLGWAVCVCVLSLFCSFLCCRLLLIILGLDGF